MPTRPIICTKTPGAENENKLSKAPSFTSSHPISSPVDQILSLQKTVGNQAVQKLFRSGAIQAKKRCGQPGDKYEQEADRVADQVMRMPQSPLNWRTRDRDPGIMSFNTDLTCVHILYG